MRISVVLPCYNEEENIAIAVRETLAWLDAAGIGGEVIVVNDGSKDGSADVIGKFCKEDARVRVVTHEQNRGYGVAVRSGCDAAKEESIAFVDSDRQFHPADLSLLLPHLEKFPVVVGRRRKRADPFMRNVFGKVLGCLIFVVFGIWIRDVNCGMKVFRKSVWPKIRPEHGTEKFFNAELFLRMRREKIIWRQIDVPHYPRLAGNPTGGSMRVIVNMFREIWNLKKAMHANT
ncbi:glycosyltransferase family 2 protein [Candidatus Peregrinibacteria bacterium]|nr:glycosyltransferase family 2 protein [Candidatus Peregrinibacteria bacterium]